MTKKEILFSYAMRLTGLPYRWGGDDPMAGFDCSGLAQELLAAIGLDPPGDQTAQTLYSHFVRDGVVGETGLGALCFYGADISKITHVGVMLNEESMIEAGGGGSKTTSLDAAIQQNAFIRIRLFNARKDLVAIVMPKGLSQLADSHLG